MSGDVSDMSACWRIVCVSGMHVATLAAYDRFQLIV